MGRPLRTEEGNLGRAIQWFLAHDITPLPQMFRSSGCSGRCATACRRASWTDEQADHTRRPRRIELLLIEAVTAVEVGDDDSALAALDAIELLEERIDDPTSRS